MAAEIQNRSAADLWVGTISCALESLLSDNDFVVSDRNKRFLRYIVEECLAGRGDRIKAFSVATDVFGRTSFDPVLDPIVRIEATRLRAALSRYYSTHPERAAIRITIPKGGYVPEFEEVCPAQAVSRDEREWAELQTPVPPQNDTRPQVQVGRDSGSCSGLASWQSRLP